MAVKQSVASRPQKSSKLLKGMEAYLKAVEEKKGDEYHDDPIFSGVDEETGDIIIGAGGLTIIIPPEEQK